MNKYFVLVPKEGKCCPESLSEGILHTQFNPLDPFAPQETDAGEWSKYMHGKTNLPSEFWFVTRERCYDFDFRWDSGGFMLSEQFIHLLDKHHVDNFECAKLNFVNRKGEFVTTKKYFYTKFFNPLDIINYDKSQIIFEKQGYIKKVIDLCFNDVNTPDLFVLKEWIFFNKLFCTEKITKEIESLKLRGISFIPIEKYGNVSN
ncbi:MAG: hypothetical protein LBV74_03715 [Tannerella sp.]|nr:hypothetical protein [Tannerella sp.]